MLECNTPGIISATLAQEHVPKSSVSLPFPPAYTLVPLRAKVKQIQRLICFCNPCSLQDWDARRVSKASKGRASPRRTGMEGASLPPSSSAKSQWFCYHRARGTGATGAVHRSGMSQSQRAAALRGTFAGLSRCH